MFEKTTAFSSFSVPDITQAKTFYAETLGLAVQEMPEGIELHLATGARIFIYPSPNNKPAEFTILNFIVDDIDAAVDGLIAKGVTMEQYNIPPYMVSDAKGIVRDEQHGRAMAWFKDPAGNIIGVMHEKK